MTAKSLDRLNDTPMVHRIPGPEKQHITGLSHELASPVGWVLSGHPLMELLVGRDPVCKVGDCPLHRLEKLGQPMAVVMQGCSNELRTCPGWAPALCISVCIPTSRTHHTP